MMKILMLDNYDSFTYNIVHYIEKIIGQTITVARNDKIALEKIKNFDKIVLSPGPGLPDEGGIMKALIKEYAPTKSILGICLGHQAIAEVFGAGLINMHKVYHGVATPIHVQDSSEPLFAGIPSTFEGGRYHSWIVDTNNFPDCMQITALDDEQRIMALRHKTYDVRGLQFHPESVLTPPGFDIIKNWLKK